MACEFVVEYHAEDGTRAASPAIEALGLVEQLEDQLSIYREHTEVSHLNRYAAKGPFEAEPRLFELLQLALQLYAATGGAFDVTGGPLSRTWGFLARAGRLPEESEILAARELVSSDFVELDPAHRTVRFSKPGVEINFNAIGKGYALDRVAEWMAEESVADYLCHGGSSSVLARGSDRSGVDRGWSIALPHPLKPESYLGEIILRNEGLGTTGAGVQFFEAGGRRYGHVIDPRTGWPAEGVLTATVVAPTAAEADALSTAFYVMGPGGASEYCAAHRAVRAVLVCPSDARPGDVDVHRLNLPEGRWRAAPAS